MNYVIFLSILCVSLHQASAPPPRRGEQEPPKNNEQTHEKDELEDFGLEYNRYLKEVVDLLESDPEFKKKLDDAQEADIRSGKIAQELEFVDHRVRTKLDEVKRQELERLRNLVEKQSELEEHMKTNSEHLDYKNPHTFEMEDLKKLIAKLSADLGKADEQRRQEFKEYEMQKEFEKQERLKHLEGSEKEAFEKQIQENETKHKQHEPLHHPGSKQQLEEVWEKQDHMENQEFDPKVFFQLHDLDGNGVWDQNEVKTLFLKELDKMYQAGAPEDDMRERAEEMERMREHVFGEADKNKDGLISYDEFLDKTKQPDFEKDTGWETIDQKPVYTYEEYKEFERRRQEEVQRLIQQGLIPPQPVYPPQYGYHHPPPPAPSYGHPQQQQYHHQPPPQQHFQVHPPQMSQGHPNQFQGGYQAHPPQGQHQPSSYQQQGYHPQQQQQNRQQGYHDQQQQNQHNQPDYHQQNQHNQQDYHSQQQQGHQNQQQDYHHSQQAQKQHNQVQGQNHNQPDFQQQQQIKQVYHSPDTQNHQQQYQHHLNSINDGQHGKPQQYEAQSQGYHHPPSNDIADNHHGSDSFQKSHPEAVDHGKDGKNAASPQSNHL